VRPSSAPAVPFANRRHVRDYGGALPGYTMQIVWDTIVANRDHMSTITTAERNLFASQGQTWYLYVSQIAGTAPYYREYRYSDHMDSTVYGEAGFTVEGVQGEAFTSSGSPGTVQIARAMSTYYNDHATPTPNNATPVTYVLEPQPLWAYARYGNQAESLTTVSANGVTAQTNAVAGASFWTWSWGGFQFLDHQDYGREMQSNIFYDHNPDGSWKQNPNEAGDGHVGAPQDMHGSPVVSTSVSGSTISTRTLPLEWDGGALNGATGDQAVLYKDVTLGKDVDLNFNNWPGVARYTTYYNLPFTLPNASAEIPTAYLSAAYNRFWFYDAQRGALAQTYPPQCTAAANSSLPDGMPGYSGYGGVIISNGAQTAAMGIYSKLTSVGGPTTYFTAYDYTSSGCASQTSKWAAVRAADFPAGVSTYTTYVLTGTLSGVISNMNLLYAGGY
jgi:hypothetical protein